MVFDKATWESFAKGFTVYDVAISSPTRFWLELVEQTDSPHRDPLPRTRFLSVNLKKPLGERFYFHEFGHFKFSRLAFNKGARTEVVAVDLGGHVYCYAADGDREEPQIATQLEGSDFVSSVTGIFRIQEDLYAVATDRRIFQRINSGEWREIAKGAGGIPVDKRSLTGDAGMSFGFRSISAFAPDDVYAVGGEGDVWHFDGTRWTQLPFPSNELLYTVCCAGDGNVYITGNMGSLWVGRKDRWKRLAQGTFSVPFKDTAWFAGRLWCGSDYGLWVLQDGKLEVPDQPAEVRTACGVIDISPDGLTMLTASPHGAALYDGDKWELLFSSSAFAEPSKKASERQQLGRGGERLTTHDGMQALLDVIGNDGPEASLQALADPATLDLPALRAHSWLLLVNAISAQSGWAEYNQVVNRLIELGADPDAVEQESGLTPRALALSMGLPLA